MCRCTQCAPSLRTHRHVRVCLFCLFFEFCLFILLLVLRLKYSDCVYAAFIAYRCFDCQCAASVYVTSAYLFLSAFLLTTHLLRLYPFLYSLSRLYRARNREVKRNNKFFFFFAAFSFCLLFTVLWCFFFFLKFLLSTYF
jgi:hypothetical protein